MESKELIFERINEITRDMLNNINRRNKDKNVVISPISLVFALTLAFDATNGVTKEQIKDFLCKDIPSQEVDVLISEIQKRLSYNQNVRSANAVISTAEIKSDFKDIVRNNLKAECFSKEEDKERLIEKVNTWVRRRTSGMIPKLLEEETNANAYLINALTFIADWDEEYEKSDIEEDMPFKPFDGEEEKGPFLRSMEDSYIETEDCTGFSKKYKGEEYEFIALLPKKNHSEGLNSLINGVDFKKLLGDKRSARVSVLMPEFKIEFKDELSEFCKRGGIEKAFTKTADFSNMTDVAPAYIDKIIQNAYIKVDRYGTRAAAATAISVGVGCAFIDEIKTVVLNRPFVYAIIHSETGISVFTGIVNHIK